MKQHQLRASLTFVTGISAIAFYGWYIYLHIARQGTDTPRGVSVVGIIMVMLAVATLAAALLAPTEKKSKQSILPYVVSELALLPLAITAIYVVIRAIPFFVG